MTVLESLTRVSFQLFYRRSIMAWRSHGTDNADLVRQLKENGVIKQDSGVVARTMEATDRKHYCPLNSYVDAPQSIGYEVTISAPHMHAFALELLENHIIPGNRVLDVGSGSGYLTACFARAVGPTGLVVGVEHQPALVKLGRDNITKDDPSLLEHIKLIEGDGRRGCKDFAPYNAIHVGAASPKKPVELIEQLANGGRLIVPVGAENKTQSLQQFDKDENGKVTEKSLMSVIYVPLTDLRPGN